VVAAPALAGAVVDSPRPPAPAPPSADEQLDSILDDLRATIDEAFHRGNGKLATITAVSPIARFGSLELNGDRVAQFAEKRQTGEGWINGGFFVFEPRVLDYMDDDQTSLEGKPLENLAAESQLMAYRHRGFWHPMDTMRDKQYLESLWASGKAPWKAW